MNQTYYLVDNNALLLLGRRRRLTTFFHQHCRITDDVAHEARFVRNATLPPTVIMSPWALELLKEVMRTVRPGDTDLIDLYKNKGMADPGMIAAALALAESDAELLFPDTWILVTSDRALNRLAKRMNVATTSPEALATVIDDREPLREPGA